MDFRLSNYYVGREREREREKKELRGVWGWVVNTEIVSAFDIGNLWVWRESSVKVDIGCSEEEEKQKLFFYSIVFLIKEM